MRDKNNENKGDSIIDSGASFIGGTAGGVVGTVAGMVGGPAGAIGGAVAGAAVGTAIEIVFKKIGQEIRERLLSKSESKKIQTVYDIASEKIKNRIERGDSIRNDSFFESSVDDRSAADEILEGILFAAQREAEEKKLPYLANLFSNLVFDQTTNREMANQLIKMAESLTYRELAIITAFGFFQVASSSLGPIPSERGGLRDKAYDTVHGEDKISILTEVYRLINMGILFTSQIPLDIANINPSSITIGGMGAKIFNLMELNKIPNDNIAADIMTVLTYKD